MMSSAVSASYPSRAYAQTNSSVADHANAVTFLIEHAHRFDILLEQEAGNVNDESVSFAGWDADGHQVTDEFCMSSHQSSVVSA